MTIVITCFIAALIITWCALGLMVRSLTDEIRCLKADINLITEDVIKLNLVNAGKLDDIQRKINIHLGEILDEVWNPDISSASQLEEETHRDYPHIFPLGNPKGN